MIYADIIESTPRDTSDEKAPRGSMLCNFRLCMRTPLPPPFGHYGVTFYNVTSSQKAPLGWILHNFWLRIRTLKGTPKGSRDIWLLPVAMVLALLYSILHYYYIKKKRGNWLRMR